MKIKLLLSLALLSMSPLLVASVVQVSEDEEAAQAEQVLAQEKKKGTDWGKIFSKTKAGIVAAASMPRLAGETITLVNDSTVLINQVQQQINAAKVFLNQIKLTKTDQERLAMTFNFIYNVLIPLTENFNKLSGDVAKPLKTVGGKFIKPFDEKTGKKTADLAATISTFSNEFKTVVTELKKVIKDRLDVAAQAIAAAQKK